MKSVSIRINNPNHFLFSKIIILTIQTINNFAIFYFFANAILPLPKYDTHGEGIILTGHSELQY